MNWTLLNRVFYVFLTLYLFNETEFSLAQESKGRFVGVVAVVSDYSGNLGAEPLDGAAVKMPEAMRAFARQAGYDKVDIFVLDGKEKNKVPSSSNILGELFDDTKLAKDPLDTFMFYFTGHGTRIEKEMVLLGSGAYEVLNPAYQLKLDDALALISQSRAGKKLVFIDACQSRITRGTLAAHQTLLGSDGANQIKPVQGMAVFFSNDKNEYSYVDPVRKMGYYTKHLVLALTNPKVGESDPSIRRQIRTTTDLQSYLNRAVSTEVEKSSEVQKRFQNPSISLDGNTGELPLFGVPEQVKPMTARGLGLKREASRGTVLMADLLTSVETSNLLNLPSDRPLNYEIEVRGTCLVRNLKAGEILTWNDIGLVGLCTR